MDDWRRIPGFPKYEASRYGEVRRIFKTIIRPVHGYMGSGRQYRYKLTDENGTPRLILATTLMRKTWMPNLPKELYLIHKNHDLKDNALDNLLPVTHSELGKLRNRSDDARSVVKTDLRTGRETYYKSGREAGRKNNFCYQSVLDRCNGKISAKTEAADGVIFRWVNY